MSRAQKIALAVWLIGFLIVFAALYIYITSPKFTVDYSNVVVKGCEYYKVYGNKVVVFDNGNVYVFHLPEQLIAKTNLATAVGVAGAIWIMIGLIILPLFWNDLGKDP